MWTYLCLITQGVQQTRRVWSHDLIYLTMHHPGGLVAKRGEILQCCQLESHLQHFFFFLFENGKLSVLCLRDCVHFICDRMSSCRNICRGYKWNLTSVGSTVPASWLCFFLLSPETKQINSLFRPLLWALLWQPSWRLVGQSYLWENATSPH